MKKTDRVKMEYLLDVDQFIELVQEQPAIWNKFEKCHSNRTAVDAAWIEVADAMQFDEFILRKKWKYLRDQYASEAGKIVAAEGGDPSQLGKYESKWKFFNQLHFLSGVIKPRPFLPTVGPNPTVDYKYHSVYTTVQNDDNDEEHNSSAIDDDQKPPAGPGLDGSGQMVVDSAPQSATSRTAQKRPRVDDYHETLMELEGLLKKSRKDKEDEDLMFFKSLIPHVKKIPQCKKLTFRGSIQEVVQRYAYPSESD